VHFASLEVINAPPGAATVLPSVYPYTPTVLMVDAFQLFNPAPALNLTNNELLAAAAVDDIRADIVAGQITSSSTGGGLGYIDAGGGYVAVRFTLLGDTNLDGKVDVTDLGNLASSYGAGSGAGWVQGDSNYDGKIDVTDLGNLASNYGGQLASAPSAGAAVAMATAEVAAVPEPSGLLVLVLGILAVRRRRALRS